MADPQRPKLTDVARKAGVSPATVSRVLSHPALVRHETRARVRAAVTELGYVPDGAARALASRTHGAVGIVVPTIDQAIFSRAIQALQSRLAEGGCRLLVASHEYSTATEIEATRSLIEHGIDAIVLVGSAHPDEVWRLVDRAPLPLILTWSVMEGRDCIGFDNAAAGRLAAEHLLALGHRRFGMISGARANNDRAEARVAGVRAALAAHGLELPEAMVAEAAFNLAGGRAGLQRLLAAKRPPTAVIGGNDLLASGALIEARARGLTVPGDLSIVGMDDLELSEHLALTTVHLPTVELGRHVADLVIARLSGKQTGGSMLLPVRLVVRASTGPTK